MKAAVFKEPFKFEITERSMPIPSPDEVLVQIKSVGICGSDLHGFLGLSGKRRLPGLIMGHEASGVISGMGKNVTKWKIGDRVSIDPQRSCGVCYYCKHGWSNLCANIVCIGTSRTGFTDGALQEYMVLSKDQLVALQDNLSFEEGTFLDPLGNVMHVWNRSNAKIGDTVAIIGAGVMGLLAIQMARLKGAQTIISVDCVENRLNLALKLGADVVINSKKEDTVDRIMKLTDHIGADVVMEAVGLESTYHNAIMSVRKRGTVASLGFRDDFISIPSQPFLFREITLVGNGGFSFEAAHGISMLGKGLLNVKPLITHVFPLDQVEEAFMFLHKNPNEAIKVLISVF